MGAWQAIAQGASDVAGSALGQWQANKAADLAWHRYKRRYRVTVRDMQKAGLNPILAAGVTPGPVPQGQSVGNQRSNAAQIAVNSALAAAQVRNMEANTVKTANEAIGAKERSMQAMDEREITAMQRHIMQATVREQVAAGSAHPEEWGGLASAKRTELHAKEASALRDEWNAKLMKAGFPRTLIEGSPAGYGIDTALKLFNSAKGVRR